ncbi:hypothetical protein PIB30_100119 [Stylosanthes scabra]|uniref:Uncharacterized protein n=1 Tax=Stylosanthes scabra TaxID=79078 RepID=A0ABU6YXT2_9FABA|nr:hypothetical protein [Stylosanthes scabra]
MKTVGLSTLPTFTLEGIIPSAVVDLPLKPITARGRRCPFVISSGLSNSPSLINPSSTNLHSSPGIISSQSPSRQIKGCSGFPWKSKGNTETVPQKPKPFSPNMASNSSSNMVPSESVSPSSDSYTEDCFPPLSADSTLVGD